MPSTQICWKGQRRVTPDSRLAKREVLAALTKGVPDNGIAAAVYPPVLQHRRKKRLVVMEDQSALHYVMEDQSALHYVKV